MQDASWNTHLAEPSVCSQKKEVGKKFNEDKGRSTVDEGPLDDPIAEKLRQQRCFPFSHSLIVGLLLDLSIRPDCVVPCLATLSELLRCGVSCRTSPAGRLLGDDVVQYGSKGMKKWRETLRGCVHVCLTWQAGGRG